MTLSYVDRPATHSTYYPGRPIVGITIHDTETLTDCTTQQSLGGWHWLVGREGTIYLDCDEDDQAAWHVLATGYSQESIDKTRWRPPFLVECPDHMVSDCNYCTIGIEITSHQQYRDAGVPYTDAQYDSLQALLADIEERRGILPIVFHRDMQTDRSDPVDLDLERVGLVTIAEHTYAFRPTPAPPPPEDDVDCTIYIEALAECNAIKQEFEAVLRDAKYKAKMTRAAKKQGLGLPDYLIWKARQK